MLYKLMEENMRDKRGAINLFANRKHVPYIYEYGARLDSYIEQYKNKQHTNCMC